MLRGCLLSLALLVALSVGYYFWLSTVFEPPTSYWASALVGFIVVCGIGALTNAKNAYRDWSLIAACRRGLPPRDGRMMAVAGTIHPLGQPLVAPFSGTECILCEYDLSRKQVRAESENKVNQGVDFTGFLMTPSVIRSPSGDIKLLGFPVLDGFLEQTHNSFAAARRAIDFLTTREFENRAGLKMVTVLGVFGDVWSDEDGLVEKNIRLGKIALPDLFTPELEAAIDQHLLLAQTTAADDPTSENSEVEDAEEEDSEDDEFDDDDFDDDGDEEDWDDEDLANLPGDVPQMTERRVEIGDDVCAIGIYNEQRGGLLPKSGGMTPNRLFRGTADKLERKSRGTIFSSLIGGLVVLVVVHAATFGIMHLYLNSPEVAKHHEKAAFEAVEKGDVARLERLVQRGMDVNIRRSGGRTLLMAAGDPAVSAWLIEHGADVNAASEDGETALMQAASAGNAQIVRQLIDSKADLDRRSFSYDRTALMHAVDGGKHDVAALLRQAGAEDDVITADSGQPLPEDGGQQLAACRAYLAAIHARDPAALGAMFVSSSYDFAGVDWDLWHRVRPVQVEHWTGFVRGEDATVTLGGTSGSGHPCTWIYQLRLTDGEWKIAREKELFDDR